MIRFACPGCSAVFTVADEKAGKSGKCPKCQTQLVIPAVVADVQPSATPTRDETDWTPGVPPPETPSPRQPSPAHDPNPPVEIRPCPTCGARLNVVASEIGLDIECPGCRTVFKSVQADAPPPPTSNRPPAKGTLVRVGSGSDREGDRPSERRSSRRRDDDDDRPSRRRYDEDDEDDDDRPSRRRRSRYDEDDEDEDEDEDDRPSRRRSSRRSQSSGDYERRQKPSQVQTCGVLLLVGGILGCIYGLTFILAAFGVCITLPGGVYEVVYGILAIIRGSRMMGTGTDRQPPTGLCVMAIITIVNLDIINVVLGIVGLVMLNSPEAQRYYGRY